jgi:hypothetical protein
MGPLGQPVPVHGLVGADVQIRGGRIGGPPGGWAIEVGGLAAGDHPDLVAVGGLGGVGGLLRPLATDHVVGRAGEEVHGDGVEELGGAALEEEHVVRVGDVEQGPATGHRLVQHRVELLAPVAALGDPEAFALVVHQRRRRGLQHLQRKHGRPGGEVENAFGH